MIVFRSSMIGSLMGVSKNDALPEGAITELNKIVSQEILGWQPKLDMFSIQKGIECEQDSIELYNEVFDEFHIKNVERVTKGRLTGECDINTGSKIIDIKTAYSLATFPLLLKLSKLYEWQLRAYMHLYDVNSAELAYCLVDTPIHLIKKYEDEEHHIVSHINPKLRVSTLMIYRDLAKEQQMLDRLELCHEYVYNHISILEKRNV